MRHLDLKQRGVLSHTPLLGRPGPWRALLLARRGPWRVLRLARLLPACLLLAVVLGSAAGCGSCCRRHPGPAASDAAARPDAGPPREERLRVPALGLSKDRRVLVAVLEHESDAGAQARVELLVLHRQNAPAAVAAASQTAGAVASHTAAGGAAPNAAGGAASQAAAGGAASQPGHGLPAREPSPAPGPVPSMNNPPWEQTPRFLHGRWAVVKSGGGGLEWFDRLYDASTIRPVPASQPAGGNAPSLPTSTYTVMGDAYEAVTTLGAGGPPRGAEKVGRRQRIDRGLVTEAFLSAAEYFVEAGADGGLPALPAGWAVGLRMGRCDAKDIEGEWASGRLAGGGYGRVRIEGQAFTHERLVEPKLTVQGSVRFETEQCAVTGTKPGQEEPVFQGVLRPDAGLGLVAWGSKVRPQNGVAVLWRPGGFTLADLEGEWVPHPGLAAPAGGRLSRWRILADGTVSGEGLRAADGARSSTKGRLVTGPDGRVTGSLVRVGPPPLPGGGRSP